MPLEPQKTKVKTNSTVPTDLIWLQNIGIIMRYWMIWPNTPDPATPPDGRTRARGFALILIVGLAFAIRGEIPPDQFDTQRFGLIAAGLAALLAFGLQLFAKNIQDEMGEQAVLSVYGSIICIMLFETFFETLRGAPYISQAAKDYGMANVAVTLACMATLIVFFLKAAIWDRKSASWLGILFGILMIVCAGVIARLVSVVSTETFKLVTGWISEVTN